MADIQFQSYDIETPTEVEWPETILRAQAATDAYRAQYATTFRITGAEIRAARQEGRGAFMRAIQTELTAMHRDMQRQFNTRLWADGAGTYSTLDRAPVSFWKSQVMTPSAGRPRVMVIIGQEE